MTSRLLLLPAVSVAALTLLVPAAVAKTSAPATTTSSSPSAGPTAGPTTGPTTGPTVSPTVAPSTTPSTTPTGMSTATTESLLGSFTVGEGNKTRQATVPQVFGHRGASGYRPEHTLASYTLAVQLGADYIEPDLVPTKDGVLVARHENDITGTTDVANRPEFALRKATKSIDGVAITGWFTEDFTLAELKTLRAKERLPQVRPSNTRYDGFFQIPTFAEVLQLSKDLSRQYGRTVGVAPETKHPTYFDSIGLSPEEPMLRDLRRAGLDGRKAKILIQSFETTNLRQLDRRTNLPLEQLVDSAGGPFDLTAAGRPTLYTQLVTRQGLREIATYADWVGPQKGLVLPVDPTTGATGAPSNLVRDAHAFGLRVVVFTLRDENQFMATNFRVGTDPNAKGDIFAEVTAFLDAGVDGLFADFPDSAVFARDNWVAANN